MPTSVFALGLLAAPFALHPALFGETTAPELALTATAEADGVPPPTMTGTPARGLDPVSEDASRQSEYAVRIERWQKSHDRPNSADAPGFYFAKRTAHSTALMLTFRPEIGVQGGVEIFNLSADVPASAAGVDINVKSKLSYPVDTTIAGGTILAGIGNFSLSGSLLTNLQNPWGTLLDQDFITLRSGTKNETLEFSHTESRTTLRALVLEAALRVHLVEMLYAVAGFRYESSIFDAYGATGWQRFDPMADPVPVSVPDGPAALHYDVRYRLPFIGFGIDVRDEGKPFFISAETRLLAAWSSHDDDHLLRHKKAHSSAYGAGISLNVEPAFDIGGGRFARMFVGLSGQVQFISAIGGRLQQHYYADDPTLEGDQTTQSIPDSDFSFTSLHERLLAFVAARF